MKVLRSMRVASRRKVAFRSDIWLSPNLFLICADRFGAGVMIRVMPVVKFCIDITAKPYLPLKNLKALLVAVIGRLGWAGAAVRGKSLKIAACADAQASTPEDPVHQG